MKKKICLILLAFTLFFSVFVFNVNAKTDDKNFYCPLCTKSEDDPLYKKEKQFFKKVSIIKSIYGDSIDEVVLAYTVLHRYGQDYTYNTEYTKDFDENQYKSMWNNLKSDSSDLSISKEDAEKIEENEKLDLLSIAAIVMVDSNHNQKYSDACYKEALAGDSLVGNNDNTGLFVDLQNALFCGRFSVSEEEKEPNSNSIFSKLFGTDSFLVNHIIKQNRMANVKSVCKNGYVGGLYSDVNKITDDKTKALVKKRRAQEIIDFANYYKRLYGSKDEQTNNCSVNISGSTGQFASWRQFDSEWKDISLGGVSSVGKAGCLVTSVSMQIARSGTKIGTLPSGYSEFNPGAFVTSLNEHGGFAGGGNYAWTGYSTIAPNWGMGDFIELDVSDNKSLADAISRELSSGFGSGNSQKFLVLQIHHSASSQHWVAVNGVENGQVTIFDPAKNGTTLDQNYSNWVVDGYKIMYASDVPFGQTGTTSNNTCTSDNGGVTGNIKIPEQYGGGGYTVTTIDTINWAPGTGQSALVDEWKRKGSQYKDGIAVIDGRYLIACTSTFGNVGDKIDFYLNDGTKIPTIMMDEKSQQYVPWDQNPANKWGHDNGANVLEFEVAYSFYKTYGNPGNGYNSWYKEWAGKRVSSATNLGSGNISSDNNTSYTNNSTVTSSGVTGNDIARLAVDVAVTASPKERIKMSSPHERPTMKEAEPYLKIHDAIWPDLLKKNIGTQSPYYASCAPAVLKVLHYSGADTVITKYKAADQGPYFDSSPLWERVNVDDTSKTLAEVCQPGDVINQPLTDSSRRLYPHSMIYVGNKLVRERFPNSNGDTWESSEGRTLLPGITVRGNQKVGDWRIYRLVSKSGGTCQKSGNVTADLAVAVTPVASPDKTVSAPENYHRDEFAASCGKYYTPNAWYDPTLVDQRYADYAKVMDMTINAERGGDKGYGSCSQAAAGIIRASVDPDFDATRPAAQYDYAMKHPEKWELVHVAKPGEKFDEICEPGDVLIAIEGWHHTMIYIGNKAARQKFPNTDANIFQANFKYCNYARYPKLERMDSAPVTFYIFRSTGGGEFKNSFIDISEFVNNSDVCSNEVDSCPFVHTTENNFKPSGDLGNKMAQLAVRVSTGAEGEIPRVYAHYLLDYGRQRSSVDSRMHDYIKIMDATTTRWLIEDFNGGPYMYKNPNAVYAGDGNYNNPAYCSCTQATGAIIRAVADPDFDMSGDPTKYLEGNPDKWTYVGRVKTGEKFDDICQPGDILNVQHDAASHVMMYVGNSLVKTRFPNSNANIYEGGFAGASSQQSWCPGLDYVETPIPRRRYFDIWRPTGKGNYTYPFIDIEDVLAGPMKTGYFW